MRIDQLIPAYHRGDAIGDTARHLKEFFLSQGFSSEIYCLDRDRDLQEESRLFSEFPAPDEEDVTVLHFALPSPLSGALAGMRSRKVIIYHNLTPPEFFDGYSPELARMLRTGREELLSLASCVDLALADSEFNRRELVQAGFRRTEVFPLFVDFKKYEKPPDPLVVELFEDGRTNILFVGRIVPNKKIEDLIKVLFTYKKYVSPLVRLIVVGKTGTLPTYYQSLVRMADEFYLQPEEICFTGHIPEREMIALYKASDVFLSMSEHEGFGLPLIESMVFDLPVVAYDSTAVPFTLDGAGILFREKRFDLVAELVHEAAVNRELRRGILLSQQRRLERYKSWDSRGFLLRLVKEFRG